MEALPATPPTPPGDDAMVALCRALVEAQALIKPVAHDARNTFHGYAYTSAEAIISEARDALSNAGLAIITLTWSEHGDSFTTESVDSKGNTKLTLEGNLSVSYRLVHMLGAYLDFPPAIVPWICDRGRPRDKAIASALTYSLMYFLRGLLLIPRPDEAPVDQRDDSDQAPARTNRRPQPPPAQTQNRREPEKPALSIEQARAEATQWLEGAEKVEASMVEAERALLKEARKQANAGEWQLSHAALASLRTTMAKRRAAEKSAQSVERTPEGVKYHMDGAGNGKSTNGAELQALRDQAAKFFLEIIKMDREGAVAARTAAGFTATSEIGVCEDPAKLRTLLDGLEKVAGA